MRTSNEINADTLWLMIRLLDRIPADRWAEDSPVRWLTLPLGEVENEVKRFRVLFPDKWLVCESMRCQGEDHEAVCMEIIADFTHYSAWLACMDCHAEMVHAGD